MCFPFPFSICTHRNVIVSVAARVHSDWLFFVSDPVVVIDDVLVEVLFSNLQVKGDEPLVGKWIELHVMSLVPVVHGATDLDFVMSWASVVEHENLRLLAEHCGIKCRHDGVNLLDLVWGLILVILGGSVVNILEDLLLLV